uniref:Uncharacterized protein n=1 Tax=Anguilla anguilla TaxID=7936 RepID=A0A0E9Y042_ANGAN
MPKKFMCFSGFSGIWLPCLIAMSTMDLSISESP